MYIYLKKIDREKNQYRFYALSVVKTLFQDWALVREWGRIGSNGKQRSDWFTTEEEALQALEVLKRKKEGRGYRG